MSGLSRIRVLAAILAFSVPGLVGHAAADEGALPPAIGATSDVTVVAVIDSAFSPYHWDFSASRMPQHLDEDPSNDLPLHQAPDVWLSGFPDPAIFSQYKRFVLAGDAGDAGTATEALRTADQLKWGEFPLSTPAQIGYTWFPGTKIIGALSFGERHPWVGSNSSHGARTSSVAVGNMHGSCPECVAVLLSYGGQDGAEQAIEWATSQPWIDVITNSYGFSSSGVLRDRLYSGSDVDATRTASERGQTILFSAGNGLQNDFEEPNTTLFSSQEGPDWILTVGATHPDGGTYTGSGKPVDVSAIGASYPSLGGSTVSSSGSFSGTSNSTPVVAGIYARALTWARSRLGGPSRVQASGVVAVGDPVECVSSASCELEDGVLTAEELRLRLLHAALPTPEGLRYGDGVWLGTLNGQPLGHDPGPLPVSTGEGEFASEGFGTFFASLGSDAVREGERARIYGPMDGSAVAIARPGGEREWFVVDSWCRQQIWGNWSGGAWSDGEPLPHPDPRWPLRTALAASCDRLFPPA